MARTSVAEAYELKIFESELGWMAASWQDGLLARLTFGHATPQAAIANLARGDAPAAVASSKNALVRRLQAFAAGDLRDDFLDVPLLIERRTPFQRAVIERCRRISVGETLSYARLAQAVGHTGAARAVGQVMATNRFPLIVPCHRVVAANGALGGFSAPEGIDMKRRLLAAEQAFCRC